MSDQQEDSTKLVSQEEYAPFAEHYDTTFQLAYRTEVEQHSVLQAVGEVQGLRVLEAACGTGHYTRLLRQRGAASITATDLSPEMIAVAQHAEAASPLGEITYLVRDAGNLEQMEPRHDLAVSVYLFHYATDRDHLQRMASGIAANLRPGGRFVTYTLHPDLCTNPTYYRKYKVDVFAKPGMQDGEAYSFACVAGDDWTPPLSVYYWSWEAMEGALRQAGFETVTRIAPTVSEAGIATHPPGFWDDYLQCPHCVILDATLPAA